MNLLFQISVTEPSSKSPAAFFTSFLNAEKIEKAYSNFLAGFPQLDQDDDFWSNKCVTILSNPDRFTVEYFYDVTAEDENHPKRESTIVEYTFNSELEKLFIDRFQEFKKLCHKKFPTAEHSTQLSKSEKEYIKELQHTLAKKGLSIEQLYHDADVLPVLVRPLFAIIRFLYIHFEKYSLNPRTNEFIKRALDSKPDSFHFINKNISLSSLLSICDIKDYDGSKMFKFDPSDNEIENKLTHFYNHDLEKITTPIKIFGDSMKVNYLIHKICLGTGHTVINIERSKIFMSNKVCIVADLCYTDASRIDKMAGSPKDYIDSHFYIN